MTTVSLDWLVKNGCELQKPIPTVLFEIYDQTGGNPCEDCMCQDTCPAWTKINTAPPRRTTIPRYQSQPEETVAQIAQRLGISKNEVRRRRRAGEQL